ncbi:MAG: HAMP domain-containing histidine kinase [Anaerolineae bacterium]|nr:HAMP domain-containing histidine kinase [Anaerolineae bacterium]NUQ04271.1 HAMP domain-containing histidine kinase [Anaerolineae bacterium]
MLNLSLDMPNCQGVRPANRQPVGSAEGTDALRASSLRHDMANCLTALRLRGEMLRRERLLDAEHLTPITQIVMRMEMLLHDWSSLASGTAAGSGAPDGRFDLSPLLYHIVEANRPAAAAKAQMLTLYRQSGQAMIAGSESAIQRALDNLIQNAVKYTPVKGSIAVTLTIDERWAAISIVDSGIGIPYEEQARLFAPYQRASNALASGIPGAGLGLFQARDAVEWHHGQIHLLSKEGVGTEIIVRLPLPG